VSFNDAKFTTQITQLPQRGSWAGGEDYPHRFTHRLACSWPPR